MIENIVYYTKNEIIYTNFEFLKLVIDNWYLNLYNPIT